MCRDCELFCLFCSCVVCNSAQQLKKIKSTKYSIFYRHKQPINGYVIFAHSYWNKERVSKPNRSEWTKDSQIKCALDEMPTYCVCVPTYNGMHNLTEMVMDSAWSHTHGKKPSPERKKLCEGCLSDRWRERRTKIEAREAEKKAQRCQLKWLSWEIGTPKCLFSSTNQPFTSNK